MVGLIMTELRLASLVSRNSSITVIFGRRDSMISAAFNNNRTSKHTAPHGGTIRRDELNDRRTTFTEHLLLSRPLAVEKPRKDLLISLSVIFSMYWSSTAPISCRK